MDQHETHSRKGSPSRLSGQVISVRFDAAYFFQRAVQYLNRYDLRRAEKYFRRSVELEPENVVHHCNLAGVLSEQGRYEESTEILLHVIEALDPALSEVFFYLANNYANMGDYEKAEEYVVRYLQAEPEGEYTLDAEEMLDILVEDFGGGAISREWNAKLQEENQPHELSRRLLEEGKFQEATEHLLRLIEDEPDSLAPRNNLSLAYYYLGKIEEAIEISQGVLEQDPTNIHARCNLAVYLQHQGHKGQVSQLLDSLSNVYPIHYEHTFKLATTMGILGRHEQAAKLFYLLTRWNVEDPAVWHAYAAAKYNQRDYGRAMKAWKRAASYSDQPTIADYYLNLVEQTLTTGEPMEVVSYQYQIPFYVQLKQLKEQLETHKSANPWLDPLVRSSLFWALQHGDTETKTQVIQTMALINDEETLRVLQQFVNVPEEKDSLKKLALVVLRHLGLTGTVPAFLDGQQMEVSMGNVSMDAVLDCQPLLRQVLSSVEEKLSDQFPIVVDLSKTIWLDFLEKSLEHPPRILQVDGWAAGLAYAVMQQYQAGPTQSEVATLFGVSQATVSRTSRHILQMLNRN